MTHPLDAVGTATGAVGGIVLGVGAAGPAVVPVSAVLVSANRFCVIFAVSGVVCSLVDMLDASWCTLRAVIQWADVADTTPLTLHSSWSILRCTLLTLHTITGYTRSWGVVLADPAVVRSTLQIGLAGLAAENSIL